MPFSNVSVSSLVKKYRDVLILFLINIILSIDFTRFNNFYGTDATIFPYNNPIVAQKYYYATFVGYYPWLNSISGFQLSTFIEYILVYLFSNIPFSDTFFTLFLSFIGSCFVYLLIKDILTNVTRNGFLVTFSAYLGSIFYLLSPNLGNDIYSVPLTTIYINAFLPVLIYSIRKYFLSNTYVDITIYFLTIIPIFIIIYYIAIPIYAFSLAVLIGFITIFYVIETLKQRHYLKVLIILSTTLGYIYLKFPQLIDIYKSFVNPDFLQGSFQYWVANSYCQPLYLTILGLRANQIADNYLLFSFSLILFIISVYFILSNKLSKDMEINVIFLLALIFAFLYSMPNVPFSKFWESLFFKFPILSALRTQYVEVTPFQNLLQAYLIGFGSYSVVVSVNNIKRKLSRTVLFVIPVMTIIGISIVSPINILSGGSYVVIPNSFFQTINYLNEQGSNFSVLVVPISATENGESWYHGPSLFPLFLKPQTILGGGYYSLTNYIRGILCDAYFDIYYGNVTNHSIKYVKNVFYLFNIQYIVVEKDYNSSIYPTYPSGWTFSQLQNGVNLYEKANINKLVLNNTDYEIYRTNINSSFAFYSNYNYTLNYLINSTNITSLLHPLEVRVISPLNYIIKISPEEINKTIYLYFMIPYSSQWRIFGAEVLSNSSIQGYSLFKIEPQNGTIQIIYIYSNYDYVYLELFTIFVLPFLIGMILYRFRNDIGKKFYNKNFKFIITIGK
ncbi:hypothetical protein DFR86_00940 [Acidianus sulfidivorans JP7]|uniref:hypothetical protein n=1 Tax=Acidianus sulfidivorans TaxID=312539 RepID=UPI0013A5651F|nr:hypothetical protein [Acidianus sulfidivorans]AWR96248.2 hypothetical protein DFR86_00940 [Acidianus sulfidivorans JP7]